MGSSSIKKFTSSINLSTYAAQLHQDRFQEPLEAQGVFPDQYCRPRNRFYRGFSNLLSLEFLKLVLIEFLIASPVAWYLMNRWLQDFAYKIDIGWWVFAMAGVTALLKAFFTISFQAIKAAIANPVKSLRTE